MSVPLNDNGPLLTPPPLYVKVCPDASTHSLILLSPYSPSSSSRHSTYIFNSTVDHAAQQQQALSRTLHLTYYSSLAVSII